MSPELLNLIVQGGFAGLAVWLIFDTRREAARRESRLLSIIEKQGEQLERIAKSLSAIEVRLDAIEEDR